MTTPARLSVGTVAFAVAAATARRPPPSSPPPRPVRTAHQPALRDHVRLRHRGEPDDQGGDELRRRGTGPGAALVPGLDAGRVRAELVRPLGVQLHAHRRGRHGSDAGLGQARLRHLACERRRAPSRSASVSTTWPTRSTTRWPGPGRDFALFNGTNLLPYPEGRGTDFPATVTVKTEPDLARRHRDAGRAAAAGQLPRGQLPRPGGQAVLRRAHRLRQHAGERGVDPARHLSRRCARRPGPRGRSGTTSAR